MRFQGTGVRQGPGGREFRTLDKIFVFDVV